MEIRGKFFHIDETCGVFKHLKEGEACFYKRVCDAICTLSDGTNEYKAMRDEMDFRIFPEAWAKKEKEILKQVAAVIMKLEQSNRMLDAKRMKQAYGFDAAKSLRKSNEQ